jgi:hypothetical protein
MGSPARVTCNEQELVSLYSAKTKESDPKSGWRQLIARIPMLRGINSEERNKRRRAEGPLRIIGGSDSQAKTLSAGMYEIQHSIDNETGGALLTAVVPPNTAIGKPGIRLQNTGFCNFSELVWFPQMPFGRLPHVSE